MKNYQVLQEALDKATQRGSFNLQETGVIMQALIATSSDLKELESIRGEMKAMLAARDEEKSISESLVESPAKKGK
jgi:hypothetical protein